MRNAVQSILNAIGRDSGGVAVVFCPDFGLRDWLVDQVESLAPEGTCVVRVADVAGAISAPASLVLLIPANERDVVLDLDASRDRLLGELERSHPIVLFLLRGGDGERTLALEAPSLGSWIRGSDADPEALAEIDVPAEREAFEKEQGVAPEAWLARWRSGEIPECAASYRTAHAATMIASRGQS